MQTGTGHTGHLEEAHSQDQALSHPWATTIMPCTIHPASMEQGWDLVQYSHRRPVSITTAAVHTIPQVAECMPAL